MSGMLPVSLLAVRLKNYAPVAFRLFIIDYFLFSFRHAPPLWLGRPLETVVRVKTKATFLSLKLAPWCVVQRFLVGGLFSFFLRFS